MLSKYPGSWDCLGSPLPLSRAHFLQVGLPQAAEISSSPSCPVTRLCVFASLPALCWFAGEPTNKDLKSHVGALYTIPQPLNKHAGRQARRAFISSVAEAWPCVSRILVPRAIRRRRREPSLRARWLAPRPKGAAYCSKFPFLERSLVSPCHLVSLPAKGGSRGAYKSPT